MNKWNQETQHHGVGQSSHGLENHGLVNLRNVHWNLPTAALYEHAIKNGEAQSVHFGPLVVETGKHTGRAAKDKFIVKEPSSEDKIAWGDINKPMSEDGFRWLNKKVNAYFQNRDCYVMDVYAGADDRYRMPVRVITENAVHALFARAMFIRPSDEDLKTHVPEFTVVHAPGLEANPEFDEVRSSTFIAQHFGKRRVLIGGTYYSGEIKKSVFSAMNYYLPQKGVLSMHASANIGTKGKSEGKTAIFFGLSGTGKTTLSADSERMLIGDDEHGWSDDGVFNIEGGCYAKVIRLSRDAEPEIWRTTRRFGTILENVVMDQTTRRLDLSDGTLTENTRAAYPIKFIPNHQHDGKGGQPSDVVMLTADAFGVLPPISKLTKEQAMYWFLAGYTAKVAGTEQGITEPEATFSACFGAPFMPLDPTVYAKMLGEKIEKHGVRVWLLNTGWTGGPYGVGERMSIKHTRSMLHAALDGKFDDVSYNKDPIFGLNVPASCPGVPDEVLDPKSTWSDQADYDAKAKGLAKSFHEAFAPYVENVHADVVKSGGPKA
ncbi:MAG: phosphoenolpyruvate carboxykinase (ATP) [Deltaproteobacteria bacterium]|nr:phosphoenolpyruvate carboxykinase (ATP) [Deltaproteobacteria bacterium]